jgi:hypothetical protein
MWEYFWFGIGIIILFVLYGIYDYKKMEKELSQMKATTPVSTETPNPPQLGKEVKYKVRLTNPEND